MRTRSGAKQTVWLVVWGLAGTVGYFLDCFQLDCVVLCSSDAGPGPCRCWLQLCVAACVSSVLSTVQLRAICLAGAGYSFLRCSLFFYVRICILSWLCYCLLFSRRSLALQVLTPAIRFELLWPLLLPGVPPRVFCLQVLASVFALLDRQPRAFGLAGAGSSCNCPPQRACLGWT